MEVGTRQPIWKEMSNKGGWTLMRANGSLGQMESQNKTIIGLKMLLALVGRSSRRRTLRIKTLVLFPYWLCHSLAPWSSIVSERVPLLEGVLKLTFLSLLYSFFSVGWTVGWWSPTLSSSGFIQLFSSLLSILYISLPFFSSVFWNFSALWGACFGTGSCLSWWSTPGNRCH